MPIKGAKTKLYDLYIRYYCFKTETISGVYVGTHRAPSFDIAKKKQLTIMKKQITKDTDTKAFKDDFELSVRKDSARVYANTYPFYSSLEEATNV